MGAAEPKRRLWRFERESEKARAEQLKRARKVWQETARRDRLADYEPRKVRYRIIFPMPVMPPDSKPSWAAEGFGDRRMTCRRYETCLDYAAALKWPGFDCTACPVDECSPYTQGAW